MNVLSSRRLCLHRIGQPLVDERRPVPSLERGQVLLKVRACGVCRTDLHVVDGELPDIPLPIVPGHEIVGEVVAVGEDVQWRIGARLGVPWLGFTCGVCEFCVRGQENLCDRARFTVTTSMAAMPNTSLPMPITVSLCRMPSMMCT